MWKIRRPVTTTFSKISSLITGIIFTLLSCLLYYAKGRRFARGIMAGIVVVLLALFSKVSDTQHRKKN
jgi:hypothetical protein